MEAMVAEKIKEAAVNKLDDFCKSGDLVSAIRLNDVHKFTAEDIRADGNSILMYTCANGHLEVVKWLVLEFGLTARDTLYTTCSSLCAFGQACKYGHLAIVQWLADTLLLHVHSEGHPVIKEAFGLACVNGHLKLAQWLATKYRALEIGVGARYITRLASKHGHEEVAQWLIETYKIKL